MNQPAIKAKPAIQIDYLWKIPLACFIIAGLTGFLYRIGMLGWLPSFLGLAMDNIRHAHSHLMFFGWAVPFPLFILLKHVADKKVSRPPGWQQMRFAIGGGLLFGLLAYPFFLIYGYSPVEIGSVSLPLSVILSGLVMICWYAFMWGYGKARGVLDGDEAQPWFDGALVMLFTCSLGAWGVALVQEVNLDNHLLMKAMTHFFLATFTEGWTVTALVAILVAKLGLKSEEWAVPQNLALGCIALGAPLTFPYGISESLLSPVLLAIARIGGGLAAIGLIFVVHAIIKSGRWKVNRWIWIWPVGLLAFKAVMQLVASVVPSSFWLSDHALRILYLHVLLLGAFTLTMTGWLHSRSSVADSFFYGIVAAIGSVLLSLLLPTRFWPVVLGGVWIFYALAALALLPVLAVTVYWIRISSSPNTTLNARY